MRIAVIGGGISGLAAAWELSARPGVEVTVFESTDRVGGKIATSPFAGRMVDEGADAFLRRVPDALRLCEEVGITDLVSPATGAASVWIDGELKRLPGGLVLGVPVRFDDLEASGILTPWGLARARSEPDAEGGPLDGDTSIRELIGRRYGNEVADRLVGPLLGGIAAGSIDRMSVDAVVPQIAAAARRQASLSEALAEDLARATDTGPVFAAPLGGMQELTDALASAVTDRGVEIRLGSPCTELPDADGTVVTVPAYAAARLVASRSPRAAEVLAGIRFASVVFTTLAFRAEDVPTPLDGSGFLIPDDGSTSISAVSWASSKWARWSGDPVILRVGMGRDGDEESIGLADDEVLARIGADLRTTMGIEAAPVETRVVRYPRAFPQYDVGHLDRIDRLESALAADAPDVVVCGMAHRGVGIPACIGQARRAATTLLDRLGADAQ